MTTFTTTAVDRLSRRSAIRTADESASLIRSEVAGSPRTVSLTRSRQASMRSRTYRARTMKEALTRVRRDLGGDAVILARARSAAAGSSAWGRAR